MVAQHRDLVIVIMSGAVESSGLVTETVNQQSLALRQQTLVGNLQPVMPALDHAQAQASLAIKHFGHAAARPDERLEVTRGQALLLHAELDGLDGVGRAEVAVLVLVGLDERHQHVTLVRLRSLLLGLEYGLEPAEHRPQVVVVSDRLDSH